MNSLLLPRWLTLTPRARAGEFLAELADFLAGAATLEEAVRFACRRLAQFLDAEAVVLFALDDADRRLDPVAASSPEWELMGQLGLEAVPDWQQAFDDAEPVWTERVPSVVLPGLDSPSVLTLPVIGLSRNYGCFVIAYDRAATPPDKEDAGAGMAVARLFAPHLEARLLRRQRQASDQRRDAWRQLEGDLIQSDFSPTALQRLLSAVAADLHAEAVGLFVRNADHWERVALTGAADRVPDSLPLQDGPSDTLSQETVHGSPTIMPLGSRKNPVCLLLLSGLPAENAGGNGAEWQRLAFLAAMARAQQQSRRRERSEVGLFLALFENLPESALLLDQNGCLLEVNTALCGTLGVSVAELRRRPLADFLGPSGSEALEARLQAHPPHPFTLRFEWRAGAKAGPVYELQLQPLDRSPADKPLWLGLLCDTEKEPWAEARARLAEARLEGIVDAVQDGIWLLDADGTVQRANQRLAQLFGVSQQDLGPGLPQAEILQSLKLNFAHPEEACAGWRRLQDQPDQVAWDEVELLRPHRLLERFARPLLDSRQRLVGRLEAYRDVTGRRLPEDKLVQRERLATLGYLLSGIAHELNNPLTAVTGYAELLRGSRLSGRLKEKVNRMAEEAERAGRILRSILLFARGDNQAKQAVHVVELLERTLTLRTYELKVANIDVVRDYEADLPPLAANPTHLQQVFLNILLNAEQAIRSQRQHGRISLRVGRDPEKESVQIEIADDGPGISSAVLPHIFEPFFTIKPPTLGTGLGLSISQAIIRQHGGEITVESQSGQGALFRIVLPSHSAAALLPAPPPPQRQKLPPRPGRRVLVVDDEPVVAHLIADTLRQQRFVVRVHTDSRRALSEASEKDFDLVICDLRMPELDGPAFYRLLQERKPGLSRRLLFTTGDTLARDTARFLEQVDLPNLAKPFHVDELRAAVSNALSDLEKANPAPGSPRAQESRPGR